MYIRRVLRTATAAVPLLLAASSGFAQPARSSDTLSFIAPSDNRATAGRVRDGTLYVELEARTGVWYPEGRSGMGLPVAAFSEVGHALQNPGPVIRARAGAQVVVVVHNRLSKTLTMRGLGKTRGLNVDSVGIAAGASHRFEFVASTPGTYYYAGVTGRAQEFTRGGEDSQLNGAIIVDAADASEASVRNDRVFLISWWYKLDATSPTGVERVTMAINGLTWPHTERLEVMQGDSLHWRWINMTILNHPMHLHGFYFRVDGVGDGSAYTTYATEAQRRAVTELILPGGTMEFSWSPERPGNWLLHCHVATHMSHLVSIGTERGVPASHRDHGNAQHGMAGMVMGIHVTPRGTASPLPSYHRPLRLTIESRANVFGTQPGYRYRVGDARPDGDTLFGTTGPTLQLEQGEPVAVTIVNRSHEPAAVHWHGIELESYADGVPGFSGDGRTMLPAIASGDSLTVRFTPTRAGTFMYHSHYNEIGQISSGLHGAIVVLPPGQQRTPETDRVVLFSDDGPTGDMINGPFPLTRVNGKVNADTLHLNVGATYRLRLINIRTDYSLELSLANASEISSANALVNTRGNPAPPLQWTPIAKDGADLPRHQAVVQPARLTFGPGEIHDVAFTPAVRGTFLLRYSMTELPPPLRRHGAVTVIVR